MKAGAIDKGLYMLFRGDPYQVTDREFVNPGKGSAFVRLKLKHARTGQVIREVIKSHETVEEADVEARDAQYLYSDADHLVFMDTGSYEQFNVPAASVEESITRFLKEGESYQVLMWGEDPLAVQLPLKMKLEVTDAPHAERGDTATGATKTATTETGLTLQVPLFIKTGDRVVVNTTTGAYVERA
ncbi:MAG: elongation factor P [Spirochaetaceae bacterium]|nr:elongation factor P [Spirochaetaceae bacterium]